MVAKCKVNMHITPEFKAYQLLVIFLLFFLIFPYILQVNVWSACASIAQTAMTDPLSSPTPASSNSLLDLNLNMNLNTETTLNDDMYNVKYRQPESFV